MPVKGLPGGDFAGCVLEMTGKVDNPEGFCAWKTHRLTGKWPAQESAQSGKIDLSGIKPRKDGPYPGALWDVTLIGPDPSNEVPRVESNGKTYIRSKNGLLYSVEALRRDAAVFDKCRVYDNHLTDDEFKERAGMRSFKNELAGVITEVRFDEGTTALVGVFRVGDRAYAQKLKDFHDLQILESAAGFSIDTFPVFGKVRFEGKMLDTAEGFKKVNSTDIVTEPAAGGGFDRLIAAQQTMEVQTMADITQEQVKQWIAEGIAEALAANNTAEAELETPEAGAEEVIQTVMEEVEAAIEDADTPAEAAEIVAEIAADAAEEVVEAEEEMEAETTQEAQDVDARIRTLECRLMLNAALDAAKLDDANRRVVEAAFNGRVFEKGELMTVVKRAKEAQAASDASGAVVDSGGTRFSTRGAMSPMDKATIGLMQILAPRIPVIGSLGRVEQISEDYVRARHPESMRAWINSGRDNYRPWNGKLSQWLQDVCGYNPLNIRAKEANDVSSITKNAVNLFLAAAYSVKYQWWEPITSSITVDTIDEVTLIRDYGLTDLAIVAAGGAYVDQELSDDEETGAHIKHGNTISVTLETMLLDKVDVLSRIPTKLANAWYNTKSAKAAAVFTVNTATGPVLSDTGALFNATAATSTGGHANLLTAALSFASFGAARTAMRKQTDRKLGTGNKLLATPKFLLVPVDLETTAQQIRNSEFEPGGADNDINAYYQKFDIIVVPNWTDTNDWATVADPVEFPAIFDVKVRGYEVPQIFTAGDESSGAVFTNDTWKWKVRLMTYRFSSTYDCMPVADFRGLHKNNV